MVKHSGGGVRGSRADISEEPIYGIYNELIRSRDRLAGLSPLLAKDLIPVTSALHEVVWFFMSPAGGANSPQLVEPPGSDLLRAARDRSLDPLSLLIGAVAIKLAGKGTRQTAATLADDIRDGIDSLTFDFHATKTVTLERLSDIKSHLEDRIAHVKKTRRKAFRFLQTPEMYRNRARKSETPERFLFRVYGADLKRGLTQADIRDVDPAFYNVLHVWCSRHGKRITTLVPASRTRPR